MTSTMKFWQRLLIVFGSLFFTLSVYLILSEEKTWENQHIQKKYLIESRLWPLRGNKSFNFNDNLEECQQQEPGQSHSKLSTVEMYQTTEFNLGSDGSYEMRTPPPDYPNSSENDLEPLNVIIVPHSHNDPGWLKTVDEYYVDKTKHILTNMVNKLNDYPDMTFIWSETVFFNMWWNELDDDVKVQVRRLIRRGQLEIVLGGWVMPDEASTHYVSIIDQLIEGHQWLWENLGVKPENSWSIDPFGYSGTMPYIWKQAGMDNMVIQRVHQAIKRTLASEHALEFQWRQMWDSKGSTDILCHVMPYMLYSIKFTCGPNRFICLEFDFRKIHNEVSDARTKPLDAITIPKQAKSLYEQYRRKSYLYKYNTILVPLGDDFRYDEEIEWEQQYENYKKLMDYMNNHREWKINVKFGTLNDYFKLANQENRQHVERYHNDGFPTLSGDFFPYSDKDSAYWTGYYSTRPFDKRFSRDLQAHLQAADILNTLTYVNLKKWGLDNKDKFFQFSTLLQQARRALGLFLHHDAITGTAKDFVVADYERQLATAYNNTQRVIMSSLQILTSKGNLMSPQVFFPETVRKTHTDEPVQKILNLNRDSHRVLLFNPLPQYRQEVVHVLTDTDLVELRNEKYEYVPCQIDPIWKDKTTVDSQVFQITFVVTLPPLSIVPYVFHKVEQIDLHNVFPSRISIYNTEDFEIPLKSKFYTNPPEPKPKSAIKLENDNMILYFDSKNGTIKSVLDRSSGIVTNISQEYFTYRSQGSGAYIFYPANSGETNVLYNIPIIRKISGPIYSKIDVIFDHFLQFTVKLYHVPALQAQGIHIENTVDIRPLTDREFVMRLKTSINNKDGSYFTDQNGFQLIRRKTNQNQRIEANYYPMTSTGMLQDDQLRLTIHSAQSHGCASIEPGWFEVMLDRQLIYDDNRGLGEGIRDNKIITSKFILLLEKRNGPVRHKDSNYALPSLLSISMNDFLQQPVIKSWSSLDSTIFHTTVSPLTLPMPCDVSLVTFRSLSTADFVNNGTSLVLHRRGYDCDFPQIGLQCSVKDQKLFIKNLLKVSPAHSIRETTLTHLYEKRKVQSTVQLKPMELSSYHITW